MLQLSAYILYITYGSKKETKKTTWIKTIPLIDDRDDDVQQVFVVEQDQKHFDKPKNSIKIRSKLERIHLEKHNKQWHSNISNLGQL